MTASGKKGRVIWLTGRPGSGKTNLARNLSRFLEAEGFKTVLLDSDEIRQLYFPELGYDDASRDLFYSALIALADLLSCQGLTVLVSATAHLRKWRERARKLIPNFLEIYVKCSLQECMRRDPKGLYARARKDKTIKLPGYRAVFEAPGNAEITVTTTGRPKEVVAATCWKKLKKLLH
jgi:adenylylsulfate kinase-like enzyme